MLLLLLFAFLAGIVTILSPCILPILPIVLSGTIGGGHKKPLGIVTGFIFSFTFFTLVLTALVRLLNLSADTLRGISILVVFTFGVSLLLPQVQIVLERLFSKLSGLISQQNQKSAQSTGFLGGVLLGISLGLVWTPCVGPILASVITLAATSSVSFAAVLITLAYSAGTAIPLLAITYGGRQLLQKNQWLLQNTGNIQKVFGVLMILTALAIFLNFDRQFQAYIVEKFPQYGAGLTKLEDNKIVKDQLNNLQNKKESEPQSLMDTIKDSFAPQAPELIPGGLWFNLPANEKILTLESLRGKVVLIDFWTYTCINCIRTLPYLKDWNTKYKDKGLVIIGVHTPEFEFEKNPINVQKAIKDFGIEYPVMQDNEYATWNAYSNRYWPAEYFIDKDGKIRRTHFGEGEYDKSEEFIQQLLKESGNNVSNVNINTSKYQTNANTPEIYLGFGRIQYLSSPEAVQQNQRSLYSTSQSLPKNTFAYKGYWNIGEEYAMPEVGSSLILNFDAQQVFLVMKPKVEGKSGLVKVYLDDKLVKNEAAEDVVNGLVRAEDNRLYKLINLYQPGNHILRLEFQDNNLELFAFTFG